MNRQKVLTAITYIVPINRKLRYTIMVSSFVVNGHPLEYGITWGFVMMMVEEFVLLRAASQMSNHLMSVRISLVYL